MCLSTTNQGGVSKDAFATLNLGMHVGDEQELVHSNRAKFALALTKYASQAKPITWLNQTHSNTVVSLIEPIPAAALVADAAYTRTENLACTVMSADCMAIMLSNRNGTEVAAVHAGWKGLLDGVIENTVSKFLSARDELHVWFAPSICQQHFEVGFEVADLFSLYSDALAPSANDKKILLDLVCVAANKLKALGVHHLYYSEQCTYSTENLFSHRKATHQGKIACGRMANLILINKLYN